jgi:hypothetical protein
VEHSSGIYVLAVIIGLIIRIAIVSWVYNDAQERGNNGCLWAILVFISPLLALVIYLIFFRGTGRRHEAINRNDDFTYRAKGMHGNLGLPADSSSKADSNYYDAELDKLIDLGDFSGARSYLRDMQKMAREMNDKKALANYSVYEQRITQAQASGRGTTFTKRSGSEFDPK